MRMDYALQEPRKLKIDWWGITHIIARAFFINSVVFFGLSTYMTWGLPDLRLTYEYLDLAGMWSLIGGVSCYFGLLIACLKYTEK